MDNYLITRYTKLFETLSMELRLELLSRLTEVIKKGFKKSEEEKSKLLKELYGLWKDIDEEVVKDIYDSRTISDKEINF